MCFGDALSLFIARRWGVFFPGVGDGGFGAGFGGAARRGFGNGEVVHGGLCTWFRLEQQDLRGVYIDSRCCLEETMLIASTYGGLKVEE